MRWGIRTVQCIVLNVQNNVQSKNGMGQLYIRVHY